MRNSDHWWWNADDSQAPGFSLTFAPGQVTFPGNTKTGCVSVTVVHPDKVPMSPGFGQQPRFIVTIQPTGAVFNPPAPITLPNIDGLAPNAITEMYSFDHDIGSFVAIGTGQVSSDGTVIRVQCGGVGVVKAGWHCGGDPSSSGTCATCPVCQFLADAAGCQPDPLQTTCTSACMQGQVGLCQNGNCICQPPPTVDVLPNGNITLLNPAQSLPIAIKLHGGHGPQQVSLSVSPPGSASLDTSSLTLSDGGMQTVTATPLARSQSVNDITVTASANGAQIGAGSFTIVDVTLNTSSPGHISASDTPPAMAAMSIDRIPPRVATTITVDVEPNLGSSGQAISLVAMGTGPQNGIFSLNGGTTLALTAKTDVAVNGGLPQTTPGSAGNLKIGIQVNGQNAFSSNGFSVAAIPTGLNEVFRALEVSDNVSAAPTCLTCSRSLGCLETSSNKSAVSRFVSPRPQTA